MFVAALTVGVAGGLAGWLLRRSPLVFIVPGVLMLVPGSAGFNSILQLFNDQAVSGITRRVRHLLDGDVDRLRPDGLRGGPAPPFHAGCAAHRWSRRSLIP